MQVVILCGGSGTRLREQTEFIPKPMIKIGPYPMVVHIMKLYAHYGFKSFVLALGYKQEIFKEYFLHYHEINQDLHIDSSGKCSTVVNDKWDIVLSDTGETTLKGGRLKQIERYIKEVTFMMSYGDSIGNINIPALLSFHHSHGKMVTITGVHPTPRFGEIFHNNGTAGTYAEKIKTGCVVNGGFMVMDRGIFNYLDENCDLEIGPLEKIALEGQMMVYEHHGWWGCMDTLHDVGVLQELWNTGRAPWRVW